MTHEPFFFHVDLDAFFASVEQLDHPEYRGKPVIVGGDADKRGVVSTCSYEARKFGVHSAMPMARAVSLCPHAVFVRGDMHRYAEKSREVMRILDSFSPSIQQISIDEAFIDMTGTERLFGTPVESARALKEKVRSETGLTISVGVAPNRYLAKIASGLSKPDGLVIVKPGDEGSFMRALRLKDVWGIGAKTRERLEGAGLPDVEKILSCSEPLLQSILGQAGGSYLYSVVRGIDPGICSAESATRSLSSERTFAEDVLDRETLDTVLLDLSSDIMYRLIDEGFSGKTVHVKIRYADFRTVSVQETGDRSISDSSDLFSRAKALLDRKIERGNPVRLLGVGVFNVTDGPIIEQQDLFTQSDGARKRKVEEALHALAKKRGNRMVTKARLIERPEEKNNP
jgi:DNA polymerase-4